MENLLKDHWDFLRDKTTNISGILAELISQKILSLDEIELIKNPFRNATSNDTFDCLYTTLVRKNLSPEILKNILLDTSNNHIVDQIWGNTCTDENEDVDFNDNIKLNLDKIKEESPLTFGFLQIISFLKAKEIPKLILEEFAEFHKIHDREIEKIQEILIKYDLVKLEIRGENQLYSMHRLVQNSIKSSIENEHQILLECSEIMKNICSKYKALDTLYILQHVIHLLLYLIEFVQKRINDDNEDFDQLQKLNNAIVELILNKNLQRWHSEIKEIDKIFKKYFENVEKIVDSKDLYRFYLAMSLCFINKNEFTNALQLSEKFLVHFRVLFGEISDQVFAVYNNIGVCYSCLNEFGKALEFHEKSLKIGIQVYGVDSSELIFRYHHLGIVCYSMKDFKKCQEYLIRGLELARIHQEENTHIASSDYFTLACVNLELGKMKNSKEDFGKSLGIFIQLYGEKSSQVFERLEEIGNSCLILNPSLALKYFQKLSDLQVKFCNQTSKDTLEKIHMCNLKLQEKGSFLRKLKMLFY